MELYICSNTRRRANCPYTLSSWYHTNQPSSSLTTGSVALNSAGYCLLLEEYYTAGRRRRRVLPLPSCRSTGAASHHHKSWKLKPECLCASLQNITYIFITNHHFQTYTYTLNSTSIASRTTKTYTKRLLFLA